jgi:hypothetical protein
VSAQPLIDPARQPDDALERTLGVKSGGQLSRETDRVRKADRSRLIVISTDPIDWYRANVGGSGDAAYGMRLGTPSSDSAWAMTNIPWPAPGPCRVLRLPAQRDDHADRDDPHPVAAGAPGGEGRDDRGADRDGGNVRAGDGGHGPDRRRRIRGRAVMRGAVDGA